MPTVEYAKEAASLHTKSCTCNAMLIAFCVLLLELEIYCTLLDLQKSLRRVHASNYNRKI